MKTLIRILILCSVILMTARSAEAITVVIANDPNGAFQAVSTGTNPLTGHETSEFNLQSAYQDLFGSPSPNALPQRSIWGETPTQMSFGFRAEGDNVKVETFQEFDLDVFGDYWTLDSKLTFDPSSAIIVDPNDHIQWDGTLTHFGKASSNDIPHEGDDISGLPMEFSIDLSAGNKTPGLFSQLAYGVDGNAADHPSVGHADAVIGIMQARVTSPSIFFDEIEGSYTGLMVGLHLDGREPVVPEPATIFLLGGGLAGSLFFRRRNKKDGNASL